MMVLPPVAGVNAGRSAGGGLLDGIKNAISGGASGAPGQVDPGPKGDGSVGLFDGVLKKALFGGAAGAALGFLPFLPGGPIIGGVMGALGGAAMGMFSNWSKMRAIKQENEAMLAAMGVQVQQPEIQQVLQSGNVSQLIPMMQSAQQGDPNQLAAQQAAAIQQGQVPLVVDPATANIQQSPVPTQGVVTVGAGATGAINPNLAVDPGIAPAVVAAQGGGGAAGDVGRPAPPSGAVATDASMVAPVQAGLGAPAATTDAAAGAAAATAEPVSEEQAKIILMIQQLQTQIDQLKDMIAQDERRRAESDAAAAAAQARAA